MQKVKMEEVEKMRAEECKQPMAWWYLTSQRTQETRVLGAGWAAAWCSTAGTCTPCGRLGNVASIPVGNA
jgi:hypothetical protein